MNDFELALAPGIPLGEAASYFISLKKMAAPGDLPDESGVLEGQFPVPVEQVLQFMGKIVHDEMATIYAYHVYAQSLRDLTHEAIADHFLEHAADEETHMDFLLKRMAVLGGPVQVPDIEAPTASTNPIDIIKTMIRMEQEAVADWRQLAQMVGENAMKVTAEDYAAKEQDHLDDLWQMLPAEAKQSVLTQQPGAAPPEAPTEAAPGAPPEVTAEPAPDLSAVAAEAPKTAGALLAKMAGMFAETPEEKSELAALALDYALRGGVLGFSTEGLHQSLFGGPSSLSKSLLRGGAGALAGAMGGALGAGAGYATGPVAGTAIGGAVPALTTHWMPGAGMLTPAVVAAYSSSAGHKLREKHEGAKKQASKEPEHITKAHQRTEANLAARAKTHEGTRGEVYGDVIGRLVGAGVGGAVGHRAGGVIPALAGAALAQHLGGKTGRTIGKEVDTYREHQKHGAAFARATGKGIFSKTADPLSAYLAQQQQGAVAQEQAESVFYKQKLQEQAALRSNLEQQLQQISQQAEQAQQASEQKDQQLQVIQGAQQSAQEAATRAMVQAVQANQETIQHQQLATGATKGLQDLRSQLRMLADQADPMQAGPMGGPSGLDQGPVTGAQPASGPAGQAITPPPEMAPPEQGAPQAPAAQAYMGQAPQQIQGTPKTGSAAGLSRAVPYAMMGAGLGAGANLASIGLGDEGLRRKVQEMEASGEGGFGHAMDLAQSKIRLALRELSVNHPGASTALAAGAGALAGGMHGPEIVDRVSNIIRNVRG